MQYKKGDYLTVTKYTMDLAGSIKPVLVDAKILAAQDGYYKLAVMPVDGDVETVVCTQQQLAHMGAGQVLSD